MYQRMGTGYLRSFTRFQFKAAIIAAFLRFTYVLGSADNQFFTLYIRFVMIEYGLHCEKGVQGMDFQCFKAEKIKNQRVMSRGCRFIYMDQKDVSRKNGGSM